MIKRAIILILILGGLYWLTTSLRNDSPETPKKEETKVEETTEKSEEKDADKDAEAKSEDTKAEEADVKKEEVKEVAVEQKESTTKAAAKPAIVTPVVKDAVVEETVSAPVTKTVPRVYYPNRTTTVKVYLYEWAVDISTKEIPSGTVQFEVVNNGKFSHNFNIKGIKNFGKVPPRQSANFSVQLLPGEFEIYSNKRDDYENGMVEGIVIVK